MSDDPVLERIADALNTFNAGRRGDARREFAAIWEDIASSGNNFHRCILAHYMADAQDDPAEELAWDRQALAAAESLTRETAGDPDASLGVLSFFPSLHLNLADVLHRLGEAAEARRYLGLARTTVEGLADDGYGRLMRDGIGRLEQKLGAGVV